VIRGIFFDAHGVLYDREESTWHHASRLLTARGYTGDLAGAVRDRLIDLNNQASTGRITAETFWDEFLRAHGVADAAVRSGVMRDILAQTHRVVAVPGAASTLAALKRRGLILGIITDTIYPLGWKMQWLAGVGVAPYIDVVACSTAIGVRKPDAGIYRHALQQAGLTAAEAVFVGHESRELEGARQVGMTTVAVNDDLDARANYTVTSLAGLLTLPLFNRG